MTMRSCMRALRSSPRLLAAAAAAWYRSILCCSASSASRGAGGGSVLVFFRGGREGEEPEKKLQSLLLLSGEEFGVRNWPSGVSTCGGRRWFRGWRGRDGAGRRRLLGQRVCGEGGNISTQNPPKTTQNQSPGTSGTATGAFFSFFFWSLGSHREAAGRRSAPRAGPAPPPPAGRQDSEKAGEKRKKTNQNRLFFGPERCSRPG